MNMFLNITRLEKMIDMLFAKPLAKVDLANVAWMVEQAFLPVQAGGKMDVERIGNIAS